MYNVSSHALDVSEYHDISTCISHHDQRIVIHIDLCSKCIVPALQDCIFNLVFEHILPSDIVQDELGTSRSYIKSQGQSENVT